MTLKGNIVFRGRSGENYRFQVWPVGTLFKPVGAVCLLSRRSYRNPNFAHTASHECLHIGSTGDLSRLAYDSPWFDGANCICIYMDSDAAHRALVESDLTEALGTWTTGFRVELDSTAAVTAGAEAMKP